MSELLPLSYVLKEFLRAAQEFKPQNTSGLRHTAACWSLRAALENVLLLEDDGRWPERESAQIAMCILAQDVLFLGGCDFFDKKDGPLVEHIKSLREHIRQWAATIPPPGD